jgi:endo-1,4-beta-xylanase
MDIENKSLCKTYGNFFTIGAAVSSETIKTHERLLKKHFNSLTCDNEMKYSIIHPEENKWCFDGADKVVAFAEENNMSVRGHTFVWHNQTPDWVFLNNRGDNISKELLLGRMKEYIVTMMQRYKGEVYCWDVINEAINDEPNEEFRKSKWYEIIGPDYIRKAFEYARQADPEALLFYNDYNAVYPGKRDRIYALVKCLKEHFILDGVGLQGHWNIYDPKYDMIRDTLDMYASLELQIQITELDMSVFAFEDHRLDIKSPTEEMEWLQQERYESIFKIFREYRDVITSVTFWGIADDYTWLDNFPAKGRKNWPFLFDTQHKAKRSLAGVINFE